MEPIRLGGGISDRLLFGDDFRFPLGLMGARAALRGGLAISASIMKNYAAYGIGSRETRRPRLGSCRRFANPQRDVSSFEFLRRRPDTSVRVCCVVARADGSGRVRGVPVSDLPRCRRICSGESLRSPFTATETNKEVATGSIQNTCDHQISTAFNGHWRSVRDQGACPSGGGPEGGFRRVAFRISPKSRVVSLRQARAANP